MRKNSGAALITVLVVVVIVVTIISDLMVDNYRSVVRLHNRQLVEQADVIMHGAFDFGRAALATSGATSPIDTLKDIWAQPIPKIKVLDDTYMSGTIVDEQSKFNLNDLVYNGKINTTVLQQFMSLLANLNIQPGMATSVAQYIGAPQYNSDVAMQYQLKKPAMWPAGRPFVDISELLLVQGMTPNVVNKLSKYVTAIPENGITESAIESKPVDQGGAFVANAGKITVNVNTASAEVISARGNISLAVAQRVVSFRETLPFINIDMLQTFLGKNGVMIKGKDNTPTAVDISGLGVTSSYFTIHATIDSQDDKFNSVMMVYRASRGGEWPSVLWEHLE